MKPWIKFLVGALLLAITARVQAQITPTGVSASRTDAASVTSVSTSTRSALAVIDSMTGA